MDAYSYESSTPIKSIFGFELLEEGVVTEETLEGCSPNQRRCSSQRCD